MSCLASSWASSRRLSASALRRRASSSARAACRRIALASASASAESWSAYCWARSSRVCGSLPPASARAGRAAHRRRDARGRPATGTRRRHGTGDGTGEGTGDGTWSPGRSAPAVRRSPPICAASIAASSQTRWRLAPPIGPFWWRIGPLPLTAGDDRRVRDSGRSGWQPIAQVRSARHDLHQPVGDQAVQAAVDLRVLGRDRGCPRLRPVPRPAARRAAAPGRSRAVPRAADRASGGRCRPTPGRFGAARRTAGLPRAARRIGPGSGRRRSAGPERCRPVRRAPSRRRSSRATPRRRPAAARWPAGSRT